VAHPFGAGVESDYEADEPDGPKLAESSVDEIQDLVACGRVCAAEHTGESIRDIVQKVRLHDGEHETRDRESHHQDRHQGEHGEVGRRCGEL
jgi:hypothetical protein